MTRVLGVLYHRILAPIRTGKLGHILLSSGRAIHSCQSFLRQKPNSRVRVPTDSERPTQAKMSTDLPQETEDYDSESCPIIHLPSPHRSSDHTPKPNKCSCGWNGEPETFLNMSRTHSKEGQCAFCQFSRSIARAKKAINSSSNEFTRDRLVRDNPMVSLMTFTPLNLRGTPFEHYGFHQRRWTHLDGLYETSVQWAQNRIAECLVSHPECRRTQGDGSFTPSRALNVDPLNIDGDIVLEDRSSIPPGTPYVALSYCWGGHIPQCITTLDTIEQNMRRIRWSTLPKTFQDAVNFTRSLGLKYLWIDSMCIIQGDPVDWSEQAGQMFFIYGNAYVTLASLYGRTGASGLRSISMEEQSVKVAELAIGERRCPVYMRRLHYLQKFRDDYTAWRNPEGGEWGPLLWRAWTYQERMVSPRVLYFTESEILFQCFGAVACECGAMQNEPPFYPSVYDKTEYFNGLFKFDEDADWKTPVPAEKGPDPRRDERQREIARRWRENVVEVYSNLALTNPKDRLPAIGALAHQFQQVRPDETYLAGLWSGSLIEDLLWECNPFLDGRGWIELERKDVLNRPYSLPTWSWASLPSGIAYAADKQEQEWQWLAEVVEAKCEYAGNDTFGLLESSRLVLRGRLLPCLIEWKDRERDDVVILPAGTPAESKGEPSLAPGTYSLIYMDRDDAGYQCIPLRQQVYILQMMKGGQGRDQMRKFLILRREEEGKDVFTRAGIVSFALNTVIGRKITEYDATPFNVFEKEGIVTDCEIR